MEQRMEVQVDGSWYELDLLDNTPPSYNYATGDLGTPAERKIGYSNTLAIKKTGNNIRVLGVNNYNLDSLAYRLNSKYPYKRYLGSRLINEGILVINNIQRDAININLVDNAIALLDKWASTTVTAMFNDAGFRSSIPTDYHASYDALKEYLIPTLSYTFLLPPNIAGRTFPVASFPNTLNVIGDKFNKNTAGVRTANTINPYQTRPLLNAKVLLELSCYANGYTPDFSSNTETTQLDDLYIVAKGTQKPLPPLLTADLDCAPSIGYYGEQFNVDQWSTFFMFQYFLPSDALRPMDITGWYDPIGDPNNPFVPLNATQAVVRPLANESNFIGTIEATTPSDKVYRFSFIGVWMNIANTAPVFKIYTRADPVSPLYNPQDKYVRGYGGEWAGTDTKMIFDKAGLQEYPDGADPANFLGVIVYCGARDNATNAKVPYLEDCVVTETYLPLSIAVNLLDENQQYVYGYTNLLNDLPTESVLKVVSGIMKQQGILMNVNSKTNVARFYNYTDVISQAGSASRSLIGDWSEYYIETISDDTSFGENFGQVNRIGLSNPYQGNVYFKALLGHDSNSKYKPSSDFLNNDFSDVESAVITNMNTGTTPRQYMEFTNKGLGLVEKNGGVTGLKINRVEETPAISNSFFDPIPLMQNVNYATLPNGVDTWFNLVAQSAKLTVSMLLPQDVVNGFNPEIPVFIQDLGRVFIVNQIKEYKGSQYPCEVQLIHIPY